MLNRVCLGFHSIFHNCVNLIVCFTTMLIWVFIVLCFTSMLIWVYIMFHNCVDLSVQGLYSFDIGFRSNFIGCSPLILVLGRSEMSYKKKKNYIYCILCQSYMLNIAILRNIILGECCTPVAIIFWCHLNISLDMLHVTEICQILS